MVARGITGPLAKREPHKGAGWHWFRWGDWPQPLFRPVQSFLALADRPAALSALRGGLLRSSAGGG